MIDRYLEPIKDDLGTFLELSGVDQYAVQDFSSQHINTKGPVENFIESLDQVSVGIGASDYSTEANIKRAALVASPLLRPRSLAHFLAGVSYSEWVLTTEEDSQGMVPPKGYSFGFYHQGEPTLAKLLYQELGINAIQAIGELGDDPFTRQWDIATLAEIVGDAGKRGPARLTDRYGIRHFGRYPVSLLLDQAKYRPASDERYEVPIFVAEAGGDEVWQGDTYDQIIDTLDGKRFRPVIYEVSSEEEFYRQMAHAANPAFGFVNAHGHANYIALGRNDAEDLSIENGVNEADARVIKETWRHAGGLVLLSCFSARNAYGRRCYKGSVASYLADVVGVPVAGSRNYVDSFVLRTPKRRSNTLHVALLGNGSPRSSVIECPKRLNRARAKFKLELTMLPSSDSCKLFSAPATD